MSSDLQLEHFAEFIEGFKAYPCLKEETLTRIGTLCLNNEFNHDTPTRFQIDEKKYAVIKRASLGDNTKQAAEQLGWAEEEIVETREQLLAIHRVPEMSGVVHQSIFSGLLSVTVEPVRNKQLPRELDLIVEAFCAGIPNSMISRALGQSRQQFGSNLHLLVRKRLNANGRTNSVLRAYERGSRLVPTSPLGVGRLLPPSEPS